VNVGPYEVVREIGRGGMGVVYEVRHPSTPRRLALKLILDDGASPHELERFRREARLLTRVRHPSIVAVHAIDRTEDGRDYLVTDLVEGPTLARAQRDGAIDGRSAALIVRELALAVEEVHRNGILHRDLKPENVILTPQGVPVLLDFGVARDASSDRLTRTGVVVGTPAYMSPEQAEGGRSTELDERADVYALGATLYFLLAGVPPFSGSTTELLYSVLQKEPEWPRAAPPDLVAIVKKAMSKSREARYPRAADFAADLAEFIAGKRPSAAGPPSRVPRLAIALAIPLIAAAIGAAILLRKGPEPDASTAPRTPEHAPPTVVDDSQPRDDPTHPLTSYRKVAQWVKRHPDRSEAKKLLRKMESKRLASVTLGTFAHVSWGGPTTLLVSAQVDPGPFVVDVDADPPVKTPVPGPPHPAALCQAVCRLPGGTVRWGLAGLGRSAFIIDGDPRKPEKMTWRKVDMVVDGVEPLVASVEGARMMSMALSRDGRRVAVSGDWKAIFVLDLDDPSARPRALVPEHPDLVHALLFTSDGQRLLACTGHENAEKGSAITCFDLRNGSSRQLPRGSVPRSLAWSEGDRIAYGCNEGEIFFATPEELDRPPFIAWPAEWKEATVKTIQGLAWLPGDRLVAATGDIGDVKGSRLFTRSTDPKDPVHVIAEGLSLITSLDVSEDGLFAAIGHYQPAVVEVRAIPD
jgi:serine/threonine protein kinase